MSIKNILKTHSSRRGEQLLVTPRYERYLATNRNLLLEEEVAEFVKQELTTPQRNRRMTFSASSRGACPRAQVFQFTSAQPAEKVDSQLYAIFHQGTFIHLKWQALLLSAGILSDVEVSCRWDEMKLTGTIDGVGEVPASHPLREQHDRFGWELKSINDNGFRWVLDRGPSESHLLQIHAYMMASDLRVWSLIYENKNTQEWKEFIVHYDPEIAAKVEKELGYLNEMVKRRELPPILEECKKRSGAFKRCSFAHICLETKQWPERRIKL